MKISDLSEVNRIVEEILRLRRLKNNYPKGVYLVPHLPEERYVPTADWLLIPQVDFEDWADELIKQKIAVLKEYGVEME